MSASTLPPLNALRAFEATARLGGVGRAAQALHVTHGAVSRQIKVLEDHLGLALFVRAGRGLRLNPAGEALHAACADAFSTLEDCVRRLQRPATRPALVLGCSGSVLARWMIPRLPALQQALPGVQLQWSAQDGSFTDAQAALDAVLLLAQGPWPAGWQVRTLAPERIGVVVAPGHPAARRLHGRPVASLLEETLLHTLSRPEAWPNWAQANGLDPAGIRWMRTLLKGYADRGGTVLLSSHLLHEVEMVALIGEAIQRPDHEYHDDDTYRGYAAEMRDAAVKARAAARRSDYAAARAAVGELKKSCDTCHGDYRN